MNDNILTEHPKLAVEYCLRLKDVYGFDQTIRPGDWYYNIKHTNNPCQLFNQSNNTDMVSPYRIKIPTDFQLQDSVRGQAEKVFGIGPSWLESTEYYLHKGDDRWGVILHVANDVISVNATSFLLALYKLLIEIEEHRKEVGK